MLSQYDLFIESMRNKGYSIIGKDFEITGLADMPKLANINSDRNKIYVKFNNDEYEKYHILKSVKQLNGNLEKASKVFLYIEDKNGKELDGLSNKIIFEHFNDNMCLHTQIHNTYYETFKDSVSIAFERGVIFSDFERRHDSLIIEIINKNHEKIEIGKFNIKITNVDVLAVKKKK